MHVVIRSPQNHNENDLLDHAANFFINQKCKNDLDDQMNYYESKLSMYNENCQLMLPLLHRVYELSNST